MNKIINITAQQAQRLHYLLQKKIECESDFSSYPFWALSNKLSSVIVKGFKKKQGIDQKYDFGILRVEQYRRMLKTNLYKNYVVNMDELEYRYLGEVLNTQSMDFLIENELVSVFQMVYKNRMLKK
jgi:hypothetical protein